MKVLLARRIGARWRISNSSVLRPKKSVAYISIGTLLLSILTVAPSAPAKAATIGSGICAQTVSTNSGVSASQVGNDCVVTFTAGTNVNWTVPSGITSVRALVVGGGGGGGAWVGGGGGGGGFRDISGISVTPGLTVAVTVGSGGNPADVSNRTYSQFASNGGESKFGTTLAAGGGRGGSHPQVATNGVVASVSPLSGGSGGGGTGAGGYTGTDWDTVRIGGQGNTPSTTPSQGFNGGSGLSTSPWVAGGGGGAGGAGANGTSSAGGAGGAGASSNITGSTLFYSGGGGGIVYNSTSGAGSGGIGGGGSGGANATGTSGTTNTGGGGGGGGSNTSQTSRGGSGGSGVVVVRYSLSATPVISFNASDINSYESSATSITGLNGSTINATASAGITYDTTNYAWNFSGGTNAAGPFIDVADVSSTNFTSGITFDFEADFGSQKNNFERIIDLGEGGIENDNLIVSRDGTTSNLFAEIWRGNVPSRCTFNDAISENTMMRYTIVLDGSTCRLFRNGSSTAFDSLTYTTRPESGITLSSSFIGKSNWSGDAQYEGKIRSIRVFGGSFTPADLAGFSYKALTFASNGGTATGVTSAVTSGALRLPTAPERSGFTFNGWFTASSGGEKIGNASASYTPSATTTIYAQYTAITYAITYNENATQHQFGVTSGSAPGSATVNSGSSYIVASQGTLARQGFTFAGWNTLADGTGTTYAAGSGSFTVSGNRTLYAKWEIPQAARLIGDDEVVVPISGSYGNVRGIATDGTFVYVRTNTSGQILKVKFDGTVVSSHSVVGLPTLESLDMSYSRGCLYIRSTGTADSNLNCIDVNDWTLNLVSLPSDKKLLSGTRWLFGNLIDFPDGRIGAVSSNDYYTSTTNPTLCPTTASGATMYCKVLRLYNVTGAGKTATYSFSEDVILADTVSGWPNDDHGIATDGTYLYQIRHTGGYKVWALKSGSPSQIVFNGDGVGSCGFSTGVSNTQCSVTPAGISNATFFAHSHTGNFFIVGDYDGSKFYKTSAATPPEGPGSATSYTVTFNANDGTQTPATTTQSMVSGTATALTANAFTRSGFIFSGWTENADGTGATYTDSQNVTTSVDLSLYAKWVPIQPVDYALNFNGLNTSYADSNTASIINTNGASFTVEAWFKAESGAPENSVIVAQGTATSNAFFIQRVASSGLIDYRYGGTKVGQCGTTVLSTWNHIAVVVTEATGIECYLNGSKQTTGSYTGATPPIGTDFTIGNTRYDRSAAWKGAIDEVRVYNVARTAEQIRADAHTYGPVDTASLIAYYDFNDGTGTTAANQKYGAASNTNLTLSGSPTFADVAEPSVVNGRSVISFKRSYLNNAGGWIVPANVSALNYLVVGGGGGGGGTGTRSFSSGGGAGGSVLTGTSNVGSSTPIPIKVGLGGNGGSATDNNDPPTAGSNSTFNSTIVASGGGRGGQASPLDDPFTNNPSATSRDETNANGGGGAGQGKRHLGAFSAGFFKGGDGFSSANLELQAAGGGGGAGQVGANADTSAGGAGGAGVSSSITGTSIFYGGGGGGGKRTTTGNAGLGGQGGGGAGGKVAAGVNGSGNTGGGGGGAGGNGVAGGSGGSGVVILSYGAESFTVTYNYNNATSGNGTASATFTVGGTALTLPTPTRTGYTFAGWFEGSDFSGTALGDTYSPTQTRTIYAAWSAITCTPTSTVTGNYTVSSFTSTGTCIWTLPESVSNARVLIVGGGGGAGTGGGGGGGFLDTTKTGLSGDIAITVGSGGSGSTTTSMLGSNGSASSFGDSTAGGGAGGGRAPSSASSGLNAPTGVTTQGSGGGGNNNASALGGTGSTSGGAGVSSSVAGGGGGATQSGNTNGSGRGGDGKASDISGATELFSGGGAGGTSACTRIAGGLGGGGNGARCVSSNAPQGPNGIAGGANTGGGGGGGGGASFDGTGGDGGSGIVKVKYVSSALTPTFSTPTSTSNGFTVNITNYDTNFAFTISASVGTVTTGVATGATLPLTITGISSGQSSVITAETSADGFSGSATITGSATLATRTLTIDSGSFATTYDFDSTPPIITSTASAGAGSKSYTSATTSICNVGSSTGVVTFVSAGNCTISASIASDGSYTSASSSSITFVITKTYIITYVTNSDDAIDDGSFTVGGTAITLPTPTKTGYTFAGWFEDSGFAGSALGATYSPTQSRTLYAKWTEISYTITYSVNGATGSPERATDVYTFVGGAVTLANVGSMAKTGYSFDGWQVNGTTTKLSSPYTPTADVTLQARWAAAQYTITYFSNSGGSAPNADTFTTGDPALSLPTQGSMSRTGYTFNGWSTTINNVTTKVGTTLTTSAPINLFALWTPIDYNVIYSNENSTSGTVPATASYNIDDTIIVKANTGALVRTGYTFAGWTLTSGGSGTAYQSGDTLVMGSSSITFYPKWTANAYTISYNNNGADSGTPAATSATYTTGGPEVSLSNVGSMVKAGHTFAGWSTDPLGSPHSGGFTTTSDVTLYAIWTIKSITYAYSRGAINSSPVTSDETTTFPNTANRSALFNNSITLDSAVDATITFGSNAYKFFGWNDGNATYGRGASYVMPDSSPITFTAQWQQLFSVRYALNGGTGILTRDSECLEADYTCTINQPITLNDAPTRDGYTFAGWRNQADTETKSAGASVTVTDVSYLWYALWTPDPYEISFNSVGGSLSPATQTKYIGDSVTLPDPGTRTGYTFDGWLISSTSYGQGTTFNVGTSNVVFTAVWTANRYNVSYNWNGGSGSGSNGLVYTVGTTPIDLPTGNARDGYVFDGWQVAGTTTKLASPYAPTANVLLEARWIDGAYTITYNNFNGSSNTSASVTRATATTLPTPTRTGFTFDGWYEDADYTLRYGAGGASLTPTSSKSLTAKWVQNSLVGINPAHLNQLVELTAVAGSDNSWTGSHGASSTGASLTVPPDALPAGTKIKVSFVEDLTRPGNLIDDNNAYFTSVVVHWLTGSGATATVPDAVSGKALTLRLTNPAIVAGAKVFKILNGVATEAGTATIDGEVTITFTQDPEFVVAATKPGSPTAVTGTSGANAQSSVSWNAPLGNGGSAITGYTVTASPGGATCSTSGTSCLVTGLTNDTAYTFTATATNAIGTSAPSSASSAVTPRLVMTYAVTFNSKSGSAVGNGTFVENGTVSAPTDPTRSGFNFIGWATTDGNESTIVSFPYTPVTNADLTLYAIWRSNNPNNNNDGGSGGTQSPAPATTSSASPTATPRPNNSRAATPAPSRATDVVANPSVSIKPTPTPTTTPRPLEIFADAPKPQSGIDLPSSGQANAVIGQTEQQTTITTTQIDTTIEIGDSIAVTVTATDNAGNPVQTSPTGSVVVVRGSTVTAQGTGFKPGSPVEVWLNSDPILLGSGLADEAGKLDQTYDLGSDVPIGDHTLVLHGITPEDEVVTMALGVSVVAASGDEPESKTNFDNLILGLMALLGAFLIVGLGLFAARVMRRSKE